MAVNRVNKIAERIEVEIELAKILIKHDLYDGNKSKVSTERLSEEEIIVLKIKVSEFLGAGYDVHIDESGFLITTKER